MRRAMIMSLLLVGHSADRSCRKTQFRSYDNAGRCPRGD